MTIWHYKRFDELKLDELYNILRLRQNVFVIEQDCIYPDIDEVDKHAFHLFAEHQKSGELCAYLRVLAPGLKFAEASIGRVLIHEAYRGTGLGRELMLKSLSEIERAYPNTAIKISAQVYLEHFYQELGFITTSKPYDEDGIMHIDMVRA